MVSSLFLSFPDHLVIEQICVRDECVTVCIRSTAPSAACPLCLHPATRVHSRYLRTVAALPSGGRQVVLSLVVRKFFCQTRECPRRIFAERFPEIVRPWARMTLSLCTALEAIGFATSGEAGARLAARLGMPTSAATMLRRIKAAPAPVCEEVTKVGIDDFAFRRGLTYGTILVDLETHRVIDLLPDWATQTATAWFEAHPEIEVVSRDRGADYAAAAAQGAPQAIQVADRWHLVHNLAEALALVLEDYQAQLRAASQALAPAAVKEAEPRADDQEAFVLPDAESAAPLLASGPPYRTPVLQRVQQARRERCLGLYQQMVAWQCLGMTSASIAQQTGLSPRSVRRWLAEGMFPESRQRRRRPSLVDPYEAYILQRWQQGCRNGLQIWRKIVAQGYSGSSRALRNYLARLPGADRQAAKTSTHRRASTRKKEGSVSALSPHVLTKRATRLLLRRSTALTPRDQETVQMLCRMHPTIETAYQLIQDFLSMLVSHQAELLDPWLAAMGNCGTAAFERLGRGIEQDYAAVVAGLTLPYSSGVVEGHVNRLKLIKRMMYGRACFPLLRQRVLHVA